MAGFHFTGGGMAYWSKTYGVGCANNVVIDEKGDITVVGYVGAGTGKDGFVARLDKEGNVKWFKTYGGDYGDGFNAVKITPEGDIIVAGYTCSFEAGDKDVWVQIHLEKLEERV